MLTLKYYQDPGHGWIAIKLTKLKEWGLENKFSFYSYINGKTAYLEEDMDAQVLLDYLKEHKIEYTIVEKISNKRSNIRSYNRYPTKDMA